MKWSLDAIRKSMLVYAVTDRAWLNGRTLAECVQQAVDGGATFVQLREKDASHDEIVRLANELLPICRKAGVPFVIDDEVEIALEIGTDGVHVGQDDMACERARAMLGPDAIVGVSAQTVGQALAAQAAGADYLGVGAIYPTTTKVKTVLTSTEMLDRICKAVSIPVNAIGGLNKDNIDVLAGIPISGVCAVSAIMKADDPKKAAEELKARAQELGLTGRKGEQD